MLKKKSLRRINFNKKTQQKNWKLRIFHISNLKKMSATYKYIYTYLFWNWMHARMLFLRVAIKNTKKKCCLCLIRTFGENKQQKEIKKNVDIYRRKKKETKKNKIEGGVEKFKLNCYSLYFLLKKKNTNRKQCTLWSIRT